MICKFADVTEHDMDILFLEEFVSSKEFLNIFTSKIGIFNATVVEIEHSKTHPEFGESDMTVIIELDGKRHGLLIEDKIDAIAMPEQYERYVKRGEIGVSSAEYSAFDIFIVAPEKYLKENAEAQKYPIKIKYEECLEYFEKDSDNRKQFKLSRLKQAIFKQKSGYQVVENKAVTDFWNKYIAYQKANYCHLFLTASVGPKGTNAIWPQFKTVIDKLYIIHKSSNLKDDNGYIDLTFPGMADFLSQLETEVSETVNLNENKMFACKTGKSAAIRMIVPKLDFMSPFEEQLKAVAECFAAIEKMSETVKQFDAIKLKSFIKCKQGEKL